MDGAAGADAELRAELVGGEGDVAGGDFGLRILLAESFDGPFVQRCRRNDSEALTKGLQCLRNFFAGIQMRVLAQFGKAELTGQVKCPGLEERLAGFEEG